MYITKHFPAFPVHIQFLSSILKAIICQKVHRYLANYDFKKARIKHQHLYFITEHFKYLFTFFKGGRGLSRCSEALLVVMEGFMKKKCMVFRQVISKTNFHTNNICIIVMEPFSAFPVCSNSSSAMMKANEPQIASFSKTKIKKNQENIKRRKKFFNSQIFRNSIQ